jgi:hypothetical protein
VRRDAAAWQTAITAYARCKRCNRNHMKSAEIGRRARIGVILKLVLDKKGPPIYNRFATDFRNTSTLPSVQSNKSCSFSQLRQAASANPACLLRLKIACQRQALVYFHRPTGL